MKNRMELAVYFRDQGYTMGVEVGVFNGFYSEVLMETIPNLRLWGVDPYMVYEGYRDHKFVKSMQDAEAFAHGLLEGYPQYEFLKMTSQEAAMKFDPNSLDFVFIDGNHAFEYVKEDLELWTPKVKSGGIVSGHDYYVTPHGNVGVIRAVNDFVASNNYMLQTTDWDMTMESEDDRQPCWYFIQK